VLRLVAALLLLCLAGQTSLAKKRERSSSGGAGRAAKHATEARRYYQAGRFDRAASEWKRAYELAPTEWQYLYNQGQAYRKSNQPDRASAAYRAYLKEAHGVTGELKTQIEARIEELDRLVEAQKKVQNAPPDSPDPSSDAVVKLPAPVEERKPEAKNDAKPEAKPEPRGEVKAKPEAKPEARNDAKPEAKPEAKPDAKTEAKPEPKPVIVEPNFDSPPKPAAEARAAAVVTAPAERPATVKPRSKKWVWGVVAGVLVAGAAVGVTLVFTLPKDAEIPKSTLGNFTPSFR
jgi:hypothetical protein